MKLKDFAKLIGPELGYGKEMLITAGNIDDIFGLLRKYDFTEIIVNTEEMLILVRFYLVNVQGDKNGNQAKVMKEGKIDKFFGINLIEENESIR